MVKQIAEGVLIHESSFIQSNAVIVQGPDGALLVDPGITADEMGAIAGGLQKLGWPVAAGFATHPHWDHLLWDARFGDVPRYGTSGCAEAIQAFLANPNWRDQVAGQLPPDIEVPLDGFGLIEGLPAGAKEIPWAGPAVRIIEHQAHATGHASLLISHSGVLVAGDMLSDGLIPMLNFRAAEPIADYLAALALLEEVAHEVELVVPGHGSIGDQADFRARIELDRAYLHALRDGATFDDPRLGQSAKPGWEWVSDVHEGQVRHFTSGIARD